MGAQAAGKFRTLDSISQAALRATGKCSKPTRTEAAPCAAVPADCRLSGQICSPSSRNLVSGSSCAGWQRRVSENSAPLCPTVVRGEKEPALGGQGLGFGAGSANSLGAIATCHTASVFACRKQTLFAASFFPQVVVVKTRTSRRDSSPFFHSRIGRTERPAERSGIG
jgi:hypothetical protein